MAGRRQGHGRGHVHYKGSLPDLTALPELGLWGGFLLRWVDEVHPGRDGGCRSPAPRWGEVAEEYVADRLHQALALDDAAARPEERPNPDRCRI